MIATKKIALIISKALQLHPRKTEGVVSYDKDNLYPQRLTNLIDSSKSATASCEKAQENIFCEGFENKDFAGRMNDNGDTMNDILEFVAADTPRHRGYAYIVQYGGDMLPRAVYNVPFEYVRAVLNDDYKNNQRVNKWKVFNNWEGEPIKDTNIRTAKIYPTFNPATFAAECEEYGGIENHPGQLFYANLSNKQPYPTSPFHAVQPEMRAEAGNAVYVENTLSRGFHVCSIVSHGDFEDDDEKNAFRDAIKDMMGVDGAGSVLTVRDTNVGVSEKPFIRVDNVGTPIDSSLYTAYNEPLRKDIAIACYNVPVPLIDSSLISFSNASGEVIKEMQKIYRRSLSKIRDRISRDLAYIFDLPEEMTRIKDELNAEIEASTDNPAGTEVITE